MHVHELNPWRTVIVVSVFVIIILVGLLTMNKPLLSYKLDMRESLQDLHQKDACFFPWQLDSYLNNEMHDIVLFDIRDNFIFGQGHIPGAENISANDLTQEESIKRLEDLNKKNVTVVLYGKDQLQANGPWMLFRETGFSNVKVLLGGYDYYIKHKNDLAATRTDTSFEKGSPRYDFAEMAAPKEGAAIRAASEREPVEIQRRQKTKVAAGGC
jgi:rhodanese-related sulfurtransferase